ncbi:CBS domain-containing protein [Rhizobium leguminosarum]|jgi:CBS domain-containing protein|uniref:CBS domain-containing protein n=1 Tax=Rhizobium leguminosarum TaxID=384 RepID=A0A6P0DP80_RHILE|nr:CBS domain-containing protein [Rhizobium leguminosarum]ASS55562.1 signal transduction protein [Rhizobium leguminosarum bv. viciae]AVC51622.1 BON domain protein [Rhizobium leguminosarum bv. viciae]MBY5475010.1 CBS domain-containing protein [Rhizobium leguminosarum]MBY5482143.1 CBS domain-containing protein [Rhizobium leguminosarum]MBY5486201.1 CBS domain-containing protein [Rhizobium leguminosarum]
MLVKDVMTTKLVGVSPDNSVRRAAEIMLANQVSGVPVIDDAGRLIGILSEGDLLRRTELGGAAAAELGTFALTAEEKATAYVKSNAWKVADVMSRDPVVVGEDTSLGQVSALMQKHRIKRIPVMRDGVPIGIISRADLLKAIVAADRDETAPGDEAIRRSIAIRLSENTSLLGKDMAVTVTDGVAHLWGSIDTEECKRAARVAAESVRGVTRVVEHFSGDRP